MASDGLTVRVLIEIRDQIGGLRGEVRELREQATETNRRLDGHDRLLGHIGTELVAVHGVLKDVAHVMKGRRKLEARVDRCEADIAALKQKLG